MRILLQLAEAEAIATQIFTAVASSWEATLREASVSPGDCQRLSRAFLYPGLELDPEVAECWPPHCSPPGTGTIHPGGAPSALA